MISNLWKLSAVVTPGGTIGQIVDQDYAPNLQEIVEGGAGTINPEFTGVMEGKPMLSFTTTALHAALAIVGFNCYAIASATDFYFQSIAQGGLVDIANPTHIKVTTSLGMIIPKTLEASQGKTARLTYDMYALSADGLAAPMTITTGQALPTATQVSELFTLGPVKINAGALGAAQSVKWDFANKEEILGSDGEPYPTFAGISNRYGIRCAVNGFDVSALSTFGMAGVALTSFVTYFRKLASGGTRVANATAQHVKLSGTKGMLYPRGAKGTNDKPMEGEWNIVPAFDGTNDPVQVATASAIT